MKIWKIKIALLLFTYYPITCVTEKTPVTDKPVTLQLPNSTPQAISNTKQEILSLQQQSNELANKNITLKKLLEEKRAIKNRFKTINKTIQEKQEKNRPIFERYQKALDSKKTNSELKKQIMAIQKEMNNEHAELDSIYKKLWDIKKKIKQIAPNRPQLLKKLHEQQRLLKKMQLAAEITKLKQ